MKEIGKIYSAVDADELEVGDIIWCENAPICYEGRVRVGELKQIYDNHTCCRFVIGEYNVKTGDYDFCYQSYNFAKLICPKKHAEIYKAFKNGAKVERYCYDPDDYYDNGEWLLDNKPSWDEDEEYRVKDAAK